MYYLIVFFFIFWNRYLLNPYLLCTSEVASTFFPFFNWIGTKFRLTDYIYYKYPFCIPFLSVFYIPQILISQFSKVLTINNNFKLYTYFIFAHYLLCSFISYQVFGLFGALTITYCGYCIKPQTPPFVYTMAWIPGIFIDGWFSSLSLFMAITGGYWPILVYVIPFSSILNPESLYGLIPSLIQIIPFIWYFKKSVRNGKIEDRNYGKLPISRLKDIFIYNNSTFSLNGVQYQEMALYCGIMILFIWKISFWWIPLIYSLLTVTSLIPSIQHIPCRSIYLLILSMCFISKDYKIDYWLIVLQSILLMKNNNIFPNYPFYQWWMIPSKLYTHEKNKEKWPNFSGYLFNKMNSEYRGAFSLK